MRSAAKPSSARVQVILLAVRPWPHAYSKWRRFVDSTSCKNLKQCKRRPSFTCLCTSQYEGQYCEKKSKTSGRYLGALVSNEKSLEAPLSAGGYVGISVGAVTVLVILIIMLRKKIAAAW